MSRESLIAKFLTLNQELEKKTNDMVSGMTKEFNAQIERAIRRELNAMETALKNGALTEATYYKMRAEMLFSSLL
ncbi:MAG: hypothetical protein WCD81_11475 [Candidatus Bathyarchaeia archaeon]